ncbi:MAG: hypothetical protein AB8I08_22475 [Sandaracinaceae bacterium]
MSAETDKLQRDYDRLVVDFVHPLLAGGEVKVAQPMAPGAIHHFCLTSALDGTTDGEIFDLLHRHGSQIARLETVPWPDRDLLLLAMSAYNLLQVTDPKLDRTFARGSRKKVLAWVDEMIAEVKPPTSRASALARHALMDAFPALRRRDIVAKSWAYTYRFFGRPIDWNMFSKPLFGIEFDETERLVDVPGLFAEMDEREGTDLSGRLRALLSRSPVTELLRLELCDDFRFGLATLSVLSDDGIRGGAARSIVQRGEWHAAPRLGRALGDEGLQHTSASHLFFALALCFEVQMTATLDVPGPALPDKLDLSDPDAARYAAVLPAFFADDTMIDEVRAFDMSDRGVVQERCARLSAALPPGILDEVIPLVARCQRPTSGQPLDTPQMEIRP